MRWLFLRALERVTKDRDALQHQLETQEDELWDYLKREGKLLKIKVVSLRGILIVREEAAENERGKRHVEGGGRGDVISPGDGGGGIRGGAREAEGMGPRVEPLPSLRLRQQPLPVEGPCWCS